MKKQKMLFPLFIVLLTLGVLLYVFSPHVPAIPQQAETITELETYMHQLTASGNPPGLSVVVVKDGKVVYNKAFGFADGPRNVAATSDTVYHW